MDETTVSGEPPLRASWEKVGKQKRVQLRARGKNRVVFGTTCIQTGNLALSQADRWNQHTFQDHLRQIRRRWRGWNLVLFLDRGSPHTARASRALAAKLRIQLRFLPTACAHLNPIENLWRDLKRVALGNQDTPTAESVALEACHYLESLSQKEVQRKCGVLSPGFWLKSIMSGLSCRST